MIEVVFEWSTYTTSLCLPPIDTDRYKTQCEKVNQLRLRKSSDWLLVKVRSTVWVPVIPVMAADLEVHVCHAQRSLDGRSTHRLPLGASSRKATSSDHRTPPKRTKLRSQAHCGYRPGCRAPRITPMPASARDSCLVKASRVIRSPALLFP